MEAAPPLYWVVPFALMLLAIALFPLAAGHWWEHNRSKAIVAAVLGLPILAYYLRRDPHALLHVAEEYVSFIALLAGLYVISGGILLRGDLKSTPIANTGVLAVGTLIASLVGTTGASMLLIRPLLRANRQRTRVAHTVVFFVFLVSNIGGMLTPLGDPPLFLGYLQGVPFSWTFGLWAPWLVMSAALLATYLAWDTRAYGREPAGARRHASPQPLRVAGGLNALWLIGVVLAVAFLRAPIREGVIAALVGLSIWTTPRGVRRDNGFTTAPITEVAVLFLGIFVTMMPALEVLRLRGGELGVRAPWQFFWATGVLSSFLDNAPTYLTFLTLAQGLGLPGEVVGMPHAILAAISVGAVAMGANTYIGNAPNFMVKTIAEEAGIRMPSFFGYMAYSAAVLLPLFAVVTLLFFR